MVLKLNDSATRLSILEVAAAKSVCLAKKLPGMVYRI